MAPAKQKKTKYNCFMTLNTQRSSMRVNLSYVSMSDSESTKKTFDDSCETTSEEPFVKNDGVVNTVKKWKTKNPVNHEVSSSSNGTIAEVIQDNRNSSSSKTVTEEVETTSLNVITEKEQQLNKSCMQLKDEIMRRTQAFFDKENELAIKTSEVLSLGSMSPIQKVSEFNEDFEKRSPSVCVNIGNNQQVVMSGDGKKKNPVQVSCMTIQNSPTNEYNVSSDKTDNCQSIVSTPKKSKIDSSLEGNNLSPENCGTLLNIPVARLFTDDDPNNSMSEINSINKLVENNVMEIESNHPETSTNVASKNSRLLSTLNYSTSPILSQGNRRSRVCLSSKKKCSKRTTEVSSRLSSTILNESSIDRVPLTCSTFIERTNNGKKLNEESEENKTVNIGDKSDSDNNCKTIDLGGNSRTIEIENSVDSSSCMEMTTTSAKMPIICRSFRQTVHKSLTNFTHDNIKTYPVSNQKLKSPILIQTKESEKEVDILESIECINSNNLGKEQISLNVNTSLDRIKLADNIQKENKTPNNLQENATNQENHMEKESDTVVTQRQSTYSARSSMYVNTSLDSVKTKLSSRQSVSSVATTVRSSMQVNTSLDSVIKSPKQNKLDYNKMLSMVQEMSTATENQTKESIYSSKEKFSDSNSDLENMSLMERIRNISNTKNSKVSSNDANTNKKCIDKRKKPLVKNQNTENTEKSNENNPATLKNMVYSKDKSNNSKTIKKSNRRKYNDSKSEYVEGQNVSVISNESSIIEATPYPISRSVLMKTIIKNNIALNTKNPRKDNYSSDENSNTELETISKNKINSSPNRYASGRKETSTPDSMDTVVIDSSDESANGCDRRGEKIIIEESLNETESSKVLTNKSNKNNVSENESNNSKKNGVRRKLFPVSEGSQLISISSAEDTQVSAADIEQKKTETKKKKRKFLQKKRQEKKQVQITKEDEVNETEENSILPEKVIEKKKKPRKLKSKKIIVKKVTEISFIKNMLNNDKEETPRLSDRNSLGEFDLRNTRSNQKSNVTKGPKTVIVVTGLSKEDKDLVKSVVKGLGSAVLEVNVNLRTTHVISSGVRTINLLKGVMRGCWLVSIEWALKSLENGKWLEPSPFEMTHFSKAVQENRRDRQLFGKAYVPELFVTCGFIYVENGTSPPTSVLKELIKIGGGRITNDPSQAEIIIGSDGLKEIWILDSITTGDIQSIDEYKRN